MSHLTAEVMKAFMKGVRSAPARIAPERGAELETRIFENEKWQIRAAEGEAQFYALPGEQREIAISTAGLASLWCLTYAAVNIMDIAGRAQRAGRADITLEYHERRIDEYVQYARSLFHSDKPWPANLPLPDAAAPYDSLEGRVNNAFYGAIAWLLLHEVAHLHLGHQKQSPPSIRIKDEHAADQFATEWVLKDSGNGLALEFRLVVTSVAAAWVVLDGTVKSKGPDHPAAITRFNEITSLFRAAGNRSAGLENAAYVFHLIFDPHTPLSKQFADPLALFDAVASRMNEIFER